LTSFTAGFVMLFSIIQPYPLSASLNKVKVNKLTLRNKEKDGFVMDKVYLKWLDNI
jgi:hypothetical protein